MTVKELFPLVISNYEAVIDEITPLYARDNWWSKIQLKKCDKGICYHVVRYLVLGCDLHNMARVLHIRYYLLLLCETPCYSASKEENIRLLQFRIDAMKKAIIEFPNEEI